MGKLHVIVQPVVWIKTDFLPFVALYPLPKPIPCTFPCEITIKQETARNAASPGLHMGWSAHQMLAIKWTN